MNPVLKPSSLLHSTLPDGTVLIHSPLHRVIAAVALNSKLFESTPADLSTTRPQAAELQSEMKFSLREQAPEIVTQSHTVGSIQPQQTASDTSDFKVRFVGRDDHHKRLTDLTRSRVSFSKPLFTEPTQNPLLAANHLPLFGQIEPHHAIDALDLMLAKHTKAFESLEARIRKQRIPKFEDVVPVVIDWLEQISYMLRPFFHLSSTVSNEEFQILSKQISERMNSFQNTIFSSQIIMAALVKIRGSVQWFSITDEERKLLSGLIESYVGSGVLMHKRSSQKLMRVQQELSQLESRFSDNLVNAAKHYRFVIHDKSQLEGLNPKDLAAASVNYIERNGEGTSTAVNGPWLFLHNASSRELILKKCRVQATRQKYYIETDLLNAQGEYDNTPVMTEILRKRVELAGYHDQPDFAEMTISNRLAGSADAVQGTLLSMTFSAQAQFLKEQEELNAFAREEGHVGEIMPWDNQYFEHQLQMRNLQLDSEEVKSYYDIESAFEMMSTTVSRLFDVLLLDCTNSVDIYHQDVRCFKVLDQSDGRLLGYMYFDPFERTGQKKQGAWMMPLRSRHVRTDGTEELPVSFVSTNFENSPSGKRISIDDMVTLHHEIGHALHNLLTTVENRSFSGLNNVAWDGVEIPSQFVERFADDPKALKANSRHSLTGEKIPDELIHKIIKLKTFRKASVFMRNASLAMIDLLLHTSYDVTTADPDRIYEFADEIVTRVTGMKPQYLSHMISRFSHVFAGGYAAGYYGYIWADIYSADLYKEFESHRNHPNHQAILGRRLRDTVFAAGGLERIDQIVQKGFLGRPVNPSSLMGDMGIAVDETNDSNPT